MTPWQPLSSSNLRSCRYDPGTETLDIQFHSGRTYSYARVPSTVFQGLVDADSPGRFFNAQIKDHYAES